MNTEEHRLDTRGRRVLDVTELVLAFCSSDGRDGLVNVFVPHATAGVALMETGSGSEEARGAGTKKRERPSNCLW